MNPSRLFMSAFHSLSHLLVFAIWNERPDTFFHNAVFLKQLKMKPILQVLQSAVHLCFLYPVSWTNPREWPMFKLLLKIYLWFELHVAFHRRRMPFVKPPTSARAPLYRNISSASGRMVPGIPLLNYTLPSAIQCPRSVFVHSSPGPALITGRSFPGGDARNWRKADHGRVGVRRGNVLDLSIPLAYLRCGAWPCILHKYALCCPLTRTFRTFHRPSSAHFNGAHLMLPQATYIVSPEIERGVRGLADYVRKLVETAFAWDTQRLGPTDDKLKICFSTQFLQCTPRTFRGIFCKAQEAAAGRVSLRCPEVRSGIWERAFSLMKISFVAGGRRHR